MGAAAGGKAGVGRPLWPAGTVWEGRPLLLARPGGQGEWARDLGPRHGVCTDRRAAGQKRCCHEPPVRARAGPASSLGHGVVIRSRSGPDAAPAGQACAQLDDTKRADEHRMSGSERGSTARARRRARARDERRRDRDTYGGSAPRSPGPLPPSAPRRPAACQAFRGDHSPGRPRRTGAGLGAEGMRVPTGTGLRGEQRGADERGAGTSWGGGAGGGAPGSPPPHFLPGGLEPEGRRLAGDSASLCRRPRLLGTAAAAPIPAAGPAALLETETSLTTHE